MSVVQGAHKIVRPVQATRLFKSGNDQEFLAGEIGPIEITARDAIAADVEFAGLARRHGLLIFVQHVDAVARQRRPDGHFALGSAFMGGGDHGGFGWTVGIENAQSWPRPRRHQLRRTQLSAENQNSQARQFGRHHRQE